MVSARPTLPRKSKPPSLQKTWGDSPTVGRGLGAPFKKVDRRLCSNLIFFILGWLVGPKACSRLRTLRKQKSLRQRLL
jgi:hypothetical protein